MRISPVAPIASKAPESPTCAKVIFATSSQAAKAATSSASNPTGMTTKGSVSLKATLSTGQGRAGASHSFMLIPVGIRLQVNAVVPVTGSGI